ncbi:MAG TPA: GGDEF domain-containing protein, partial [Mycobacteriales bacterium]|nr:GGDEF domain-containing protein [Mycobacteriales bacterium]
MARQLAAFSRALGLAAPESPVAESVVRAVVETLDCRAAVVQLVGADGALHLAAVAGDDDARLTTSAPMRDPDGSLLGVLTVDEPPDGALLPSARRALLHAVAAQSAVAVAQAQSAHELRTSEQQLQRMFDESPFAGAVLGADGRFLRVNRAYCEFLGRPDADLLGHRMVEFAHPEEQDSTLRLSAQIYSGDRQVAKVEKRYLHADGTERWGRLSLTRLCDGGEDVSVLVAIEDVTETRQAEQQLRHLALHDALTGLPNRTLIFDRIEQALARSRRDGGHVAVTVIDLDHFKLVNDSYGHPAGDQMLVNVAGALRDALRGGDTAGRLGG